VEKHMTSGGRRILKQGKGEQLWNNMDCNCEQRLPCWHETKLQSLSPSWEMSHYKSTDTENMVLD
jgi:hypothetical protein